MRCRGSASRGRVASGVPRGSNAKPLKLKGAHVCACLAAAHRAGGTMKDRLLREPIEIAAGQPRLRGWGEHKPDITPARLTAPRNTRGIAAEDDANLQPTFVETLGEFRNRYVLSYTPAEVRATGWHRLEVKLKGKRGTVTARGHDVPASGKQRDWSGTRTHAFTLRPAGPSTANPIQAGHVSRIRPSVCRSRTAAHAHATRIDDISANSAGHGACQYAARC